jgi:hypothetical protein
MTGQRGAPERLSRLQGAILMLVAEGELHGEGGAYGRPEIRAKLERLGYHQLAMSYPRSLANLAKKGLIDHIPYTVRGEASGFLLGLSAKGRALVRARTLHRGKVAEGHPRAINHVGGTYETS